MPDTKTSFDPEWSLLLTACSAAPAEKNTEKIRHSLQRPIRWPLLFERADRHGVQPQLYESLQAVEDAVPAGERKLLAQAYQTNLHKNLFLSRELIRIMDCLSASNVEVFPYKGLALAEMVYGDIARRQSGDIDLLIRPSDLARIREAIHPLGYAPHSPLSADAERASLKSGYECSFDGAAGPNLLELQWAIQPRFYAIDFDMEVLFRRAVTVAVSGRSMKTLRPPDLVLVLCAHAAKHVWGRLVWLCDIARLIEQPSLDWDEIASAANHLGIARILRITLRLAHRMLGAAIPPAEGMVEGDTALRGLAEKIEAEIARDSPYNVESVAYFRLMMQLRERPMDRLRFLNRLVFTPGPGDWNAVRFPGPLFPLYRLVRLSRLAARVVRA